MPTAQIKDEIFTSQITPSKRAYYPDDTAPESPSKGQARYRLGNLLSVFDEEIKRGPGRPKKAKREKRVVFELRGKPFGLKDSGNPESIYSLCRKWMYGKDDEMENEKDDEHIPIHSSKFQSLVFTF